MFEWLVAENPPQGSPDAVTSPLRRLAALDLAELLGLDHREDEPLFVTVARPDDLVLLEVGWRGLELHVSGAGDESSAELTTDGANDGVLIARLPPQAIEEDAYFETDPVNPTSTTTVTFDASFARDWNGNTGGLTYYWDFGDGTHATGKTVTHTFSSPMWADVKLVVMKGETSQWGMYRQAVAVDSPSGSPPSTPACGTFSPAERDALIAAAQSGGGTTQDAKAGDQS